MGNPTDTPPAPKKTFDLADLPKVKHDAAPVHHVKDEGQSMRDAGVKPFAEAQDFDEMGDVNCPVTPTAKTDKKLCILPFSAKFRIGF